MPIKLTKTFWIHIGDSTIFCNICDFVKSRVLPKDIITYTGVTSDHTVVIFRIPAPKPLSKNNITKCHICESLNLDTTFKAPSISWSEIGCWRRSQNNHNRGWQPQGCLFHCTRFTVRSEIAKAFHPCLSAIPFWAVYGLLYWNMFNCSQWIMPQHHHR